MNLAIIIAGGSGKRMKTEVPKQFIAVNGKPIIIYTLEVFQNCDEIDGILLVCLDGWQDYVREYAREAGITKLQWIIRGGSTAQESICEGVLYLEQICQPDDIVVIHDAIRPLVDCEILSDCVRVCGEYGNGVSALPFREQIFVTTDEISTRQYIPRDLLKVVSTPQAYHYQKLLWAYEHCAGKDDFSGSSYANVLMAELGETLFFSKGSEKNIKLTTQNDMEIVVSLLKLKGNGGVDV